METTFKLDVTYLMMVHQVMRSAEDERVAAAALFEKQRVRREQEQAIKDYAFEFYCHHGWFPDGG